MKCKTTPVLQMVWQEYQQLQREKVAQAVVDERGVAAG